MKKTYKMLLFVVIALNIVIHSNITHADGMDSRSIQDIRFTPVNNLKDYIEKNSFLKDSIIDENKIKNKDYISTKISTAIFYPRSSFYSFLFVKITGSLYCGMHGCPLYIYKKKSTTEYKNVKNLVLNSFYIQDCQNAFYIITPENDRLNRTQLYPKTKENPESFKDVSDILPCK